MKTEKNKKDKLSKIEVLASLLSKEINGKDLVTLSEEVTACILNVSPSKTSFHYCLYLENNTKNENVKWEHLSFDIKPQMQLSYFTIKEIDYFQWFTQDTIYFLEIQNDNKNERKKLNFWKILEQCLYSINKNVPIERASLQSKKTTKKYIKKFGEINDLNEHVDKMLKKLEEKNKKESLEKELEKEINNLKITPPKLDSIINAEVSKKMFSAEGELFNYDTTKDESIQINKDENIILTIYRLDSQKYDYIICTETVNGLLISIDKINDEICGQILDNENKKFFCWITSKCYTNI